MSTTSVQPHHNTITQKPCAFCPKIGDWKTCSRCKAIYYCSITCQTQDWSEHKKKCKKSTEQTISVSIKDSKGNVASGKKKFTILSSEPTQQKQEKTLRKITHLASSVSGTTDNQSMCMNFSNDSDTAMFVQENYFSSQDVPSRYHQVRLSNNPMEVLGFVHKQNYNKALPYLWAEGNLEYKIKWIKDVLNETYHAILVLELSRFLAEKAKLSENTDLAIEAIAFQIFGLALTDADAHCIDDRSTHAIAGFLSEHYSSTNNLKFMHAKDFSKEMQIKTKELIDLAMQRLDNMASPLWTARHSLSIFSGSLPQAFPESEWSTIRMDVLEKFKKELSS